MSLVRRLYRCILTWCRKLTDWDDDDPQALPDTSSRWDKVVILKHMFTLEELEVSGHLVPVEDDLTPHRRIQPRCSRSRKIYGKNALNSDQSPMLCFSTRKKTALRAYAFPTLKQQQPVLG